jgi:stage V sporulation protein G
MMERRDKDTLVQAEEAPAEGLPLAGSPEPGPPGPTGSAEDSLPPGEIQVTEVRIQLTKEPPILAFVAITLWDAFVIHDLRVLERRDGSRVVLMPRLQGQDGRWSTVAHPIREPARRKIEETVIRAFEEEASRRGVKEASG